MSERRDDDDLTLPNIFAGDAVEPGYSAPARPYPPAGRPYSPSGEPYPPAQSHLPSGQPYSPWGQPYPPAGQPYPASAGQYAPGAAAYPAGYQDPAGYPASGYPASGYPDSGYPADSGYPDTGYADSGAVPLVPGWEQARPAETSALVASPRRSRGAILGVVGVALATVAVIVIALWVAPSWNSSSDRESPPPTAPPSPTGPTEFSQQSTDQPTTADQPTTGSSAPPESPTSGTPTTASAPTTGTGTTTAGSTSGPPTNTATTTVAGTGTSGGTGTTSAPTTTVPTTSAPTTTARPTTKTSNPPKTVTSIPPINPLGVPERQISCSSGYVVQLASELDRATFTQRVAALKRSGQLPDGAKAADSAKSCKIFTNQTNTMVLWAGPFQDRYDGCAARLAGPYDAFIKGANPGSAQEYISCLCPANTNALPRIAAASDTGAWVGELQRVLGGRLNISVGPLGPNEWGHYTLGTRSAVVKFQQSKGLPDNGVVDAKTWRALQAAQC